MVIKILTDIQKGVLQRMKPDQWYSKFDLGCRIDTLRALSRRGFLFLAPFVDGKGKIFKCKLSDGYVLMVIDNNYSMAELENKKNELNGEIGELRVKLKDKINMNNVLAKIMDRKLLIRFIDTMLVDM